jgi:hypothetical protein
MCAAVDRIASLNAVAKQRATAVAATRGKGVNCAFEAIEYVMCSVGRLDSEDLVVVVPARLANSHVHLTRRLSWNKSLTE